MFERSTLSLFAAAVFALLLAGCGHGISGTSPAPPVTAFADRSSLAADSLDTLPNVAGTYKGTIDDEHVGAGTLTIVLKQSGSAISGTFTPDWKGHSKTLDISGKVYVAKGVTHVRYTVTGTKICPANAHGTVSATHHLNGGYVVSNCGKNDTKGTYKTVKS
jgi:hypothetical protein